MSIEAFVTALTGSLDAILDWRAIHDVNKAVPAVPMRGTLAQVRSSLEAYNAQGYGIFVIINETDGLGREAHNVKSIRAQFVDLDKPDAPQQYAAAMQWALKPHMIVQSSPNKFHIYWLVQPHIDINAFSLTQRKLIAKFNGDPPIWDAPRVMRVPGFNHMKNPNAPTLVTLYQGSGWGAPRYAAGAFDWQLADIGGIDAGADISDLGSPALAAPSLEWATYALNKIDPNTLGRDEWITLTAAFKQAAWKFGEPVAKLLWDQWCAKYEFNDKGENDKQWRSIRSTKAGWPKLLKSSGAMAEFKFGAGRQGVPVVDGDVAPVAGDPAPMPPNPQQVLNGVPHDAGGGGFGTFLTPQEQAKYFIGCTFIEKDGRILTASGRFMDQNKFNGTYGGKVFIITEDGKTTDEPWKAATRGQTFQIQKVDHIRFLPMEPPGAIIVDELGRKGINTYMPANIDMREGDPTRFVEHLRRIMPSDRDLNILLNFFARIVQSPGVKIPWAPVIQSVEGVGKNVIKFCLTHAIGRVYTYYPKASELAETGGKFNAWMRNRLLILCDEVKTDDKRNMIEALKDMVSEETIQIQGKGVDQDIEDNFGNWCFFTNWQDAVPIDNKSRRWAPFFSPLQSDIDLRNAGMDAAYFSSLYKWIRFEGGREIVAWYLKNFVIDPALDPAINQRAPITSSTAQAIAVSRTKPELAIIEAIETNQPGFRNGWLSSVAVQMAFDEAKVVVSNVALNRILDGLGYRKIGRARRPYFHERSRQPILYNIRADANVDNYGPDQGYPA